MLLLVLFFLVLVASGGAYEGAGSIYSIDLSTEVLYIHMCVYDWAPTCVPRRARLVEGCTLLKTSPTPRRRSSTPNRGPLPLRHRRTQSAAASLSPRGGGCAIILYNKKCPWISAKLDSPPPWTTTISVSLCVAKISHQVHIFLAGLNYGIKACYGRTPPAIAGTPPPLQTPLPQRMNPPRKLVRVTRWTIPGTIGL